MKTAIVRRLAGLACLGLIAAMAAWVTPVAASDPADTGRWLPFDDFYDQGSLYPTTPLALGELYVAPTRSRWGSSTPAEPSTLKASE